MSTIRVGKGASLFFSSEIRTEAELELAELAEGIERELADLGRQIVEDPGGTVRAVVELPSNSLRGLLDTMELGSDRDRLELAAEFVEGGLEAALLAGPAKRVFSGLKKELGRLRGGRSGVAQGTLNQRAGALPEARALEQIAEEFPDAQLLKQRTLLGPDGKKLVDPETKTGRRVDIVISKDGEIKSVREVTSPTEARRPRKQQQLQKTERLRELYEVYIRDPQSGELIKLPPLEEVPEEIYPIP